MPDIIYVVELDQDDVTWLAWAAGLAQGSGNEGAATSFGGILRRMQAYDATAMGDAYETPDTWEDEGGPPAPEPQEERMPDPAFMPPPPAPPMNPQDAFGAGPPPGGMGVNP
jgi:hypothetical protein